MEKIELLIPSTNKRDRLHTIVWKPEGKVRCILQLSHGMIEYIDRYDRFAKYMSERNILVIGNDHMGHGESVVGNENLGYFYGKDCSRLVVRDLHRISLFIKKRYPDVPLFLLGHSMGSFLARRYAMSYGDELDGLLLLGTGGRSCLELKIGELLLKTEYKFKGARGRSQMIEKMCFAFYNRHWKPVRTSSDWLSRDEQQVDASVNHKFCNFSFTLSGYKMLFDTLEYIQKIPVTLPILFAAGSEDPVGNYGKSVRKIEKKYRNSGILDSTCIIYPEARHELLNELDYKRTHADIWRWINQRL